MSSPTLSVVLPNYNHARYIGEQLQAILDQTYQPLEIIVIDDCSTDNSIEVIQNWVEKNPLIRLVRNEQNQGVNFSLNRGLAIASGDYGYFCAADDKVLPELFEHSMGLLEQYPKAGLCCSHPAFLDDATGAIDKHEDWFHASEQPCYFSPEQLIEIVGPNGLWIAGHTCIAQRELLLEAGGYSPEIKWYSDWFVFHAMAFRHGICYIPEALAALRVLPDSYSAQRQKDTESEREVRRHLVELLRSEQYCDLIPAFIESEVLTSMPLVRTALKYPNIDPFSSEPI
ncbi:MAG: glycosyltransferase family A protein [Cyanobacteriota bacterium]|nr:glycosyltransferase family A protein [Cyanobacteriota bacterium]